MSGTLPAPGPAEDFTLRPVTVDEVLVWHHVFNTASYPTAASTFSKGWGDTRFAPINQADGAPVHTYYAASTAEAAYMESVLHDVALSPPGVFEVASLRHYHLVTLQLHSPLEFVSFHTPYLPKLGLTRAQLVDSLTDCYPETRAWAQAAYLQRPTAQAIGYGSRRNDTARCLMLFKQRLPEPPFNVLAQESLASAPRRAEVLGLARSLGVREI